MKVLPRLCKQVETLSSSITQLYAQIGGRNGSKDGKRSKKFSAQRTNRGLEVTAIPHGHGWHSVTVVTG